MSRFVSGGTDEEPTERDAAWQKAQQEIESNHKRKLDEANQQDGKSLYETLQANKAAKQEAFEESARLKNQFRSLDDDEVEFLDSVLESTRAKEKEVNKQTKEELIAFRIQQEEAVKAASLQDGEATDVTDSWSTGPRKRKKGREGTIGGLKIRRTSTADKQSAAVPATTGTVKSAKKSENEAGGSPETDSSTKTTNNAKSTISEGGLKADSNSKPPSPIATGLGLGAYSSDEDE